MEIWQCNEHKVYDNTTDDFRYRGSQRVGKNGKYHFITTHPVAYPISGDGIYRPAHIHMRISGEGQQDLITQVYFKNDPYIEKDPSSKSPDAIKRILQVRENSKKEKMVEFDVVMQKEFKPAPEAYRKISGIYQMNDQSMVEFYKDGDMLFVKRNGQIIEGLRYSGNNTFSGGETTGTLITPSLYHYGTAWDIQTGATSSTATSLTYTGYTGSFSPFSVMEGSFTLPVSWLSFTAHKQTSGALLNWSTALEQGTDSYTIQHSIDGVSWKTIGVKPAAGNSSTIQQYTFIHPHPAAGINYYRLLQRDIDGKENYSKIVSVNFGDQAKPLTIYPNPVSNGMLMVKLINPATIKVFNSVGALMLQKNLMAGETQLKLTHLSKGIYTIKAGDETISFIIQ